MERLEDVVAQGLDELPPHKRDSDTAEDGALKSK